MSYDIKEIFGKNLRREREKRNLSQEKFAELIDIGIPALSKLECGKSYPKTQTLQKIIDVFKISPHVLYVTDDDFDVNTAYDDMCMVSQFSIKMRCTPVRESLDVKDIGTI